MRRVDLGWIRIFVEAARAGSLSEAAKRLNLTQPAVSYQIRRAEAELGVPLLRRLHRGVELTEAGRQLHEILSQSVTKIDALARTFQGAQGPRVLKLYTDYAFSGLWLIPRIHRFRELHPDIDLQVIATQHTALRDLKPDDTAVVFGAADDCAMPCDLLLAECVVPVCTPAFAKEQGGDLLGRAPLIHLDSPLAPSPWFTWSEYLHRRGLDPNWRDQRASLHFNTYSLVIEAVLAGQGVALGWRGLVDGFLARKILIEAGPPLYNPARGYLIVQPGPQNAASNLLRGFLLAEAGVGQHQPPDEGP